MIILYSNGCPRCTVLEATLENANIEFEKSRDFTGVIAKGFRTAPVLEVEDGTMMSFENAMYYIRKKEGK